MTPSKLTIRQVEAFRAFMQRRSIKGAAEMLFISQPAVSRLIADCEESLGFTLFDRNQGRLVPTAEAKVLYDEVERAFLGLDRIVLAGEQIRTMRRGSLRIAGAPSVGLHLLPEAIADFQREHDGVDVALLTDSSRSVLERVAGQNYDVYFVVEEIPFPGVQLEQIYESPVACILPLNHPLSSRQVIRPEDLADQDFVSFSEPFGSRTEVDRLFADRGVLRRCHLESQISQNIIALVEQGLGVALIDSLSAHYAQARVAVRRFEPPLIRRIYLATLSGKSMSVLGAAFVSLVRRKLDALPGF
ncbi:MAG: LysR substrate-binding domain-containing protein [Holophaga sp.]|nr:LysR substrate-binding domain-containing protein [Holophaga sp.]